MKSNKVDVFTLQSLRHRLKSLMEDPINEDCKLNDYKETTKNGERKSKTPLGIWEEFSNETTMHGVMHAVNERACWKRYIWTMLVVAASFMASWNLYETVASFRSYPVTTTVNLEWRREVEYPAITICNLNPARFTALLPTIQHKLNYATDVSVL